MTWPDSIAGAILTAFAYLTLHDQHRSTTRTQHTRRTEHSHGHQNSQDHREEDDRP